MAEGRFISRNIAFSEQLGAVSLKADYLFMRILPHLDSEGRLGGSPKSIRARVCPLREDMGDAAVARALAELAEAGLINWYEVDGVQYVEYPNFERHQTGLRKDREAASRTPASSAENARILAGCGVNPDAGQTYSGPTPDGSGPTPPIVSEVKGSEVKRSTKARRGTAAPWMGEIRALWAEVYPESSGPSKGIAGTLHEVVERHGVERVVSELRSYLGSVNNPQMLNIPKWASTFGGSQRSGTLSYAEKLIGFFVKHGFTTGVPIEDHDARIDQLALEGTIKDPERLKREMRAVRPWMTLKGLRAGEESRAAERVDKLLREGPSAVAA